MKITTELLKQLIKEELQKIIEEPLRSTKEEKIFNLVRRIHFLEKKLKSVKDYIQRLESVPYIHQSHELGKKLEKSRKILKEKEAIINQKKKQLEYFDTSYDKEVAPYLQEWNKSF